MLPTSLACPSTGATAHAAARTIAGPTPRTVARALGVLLVVAAVVPTSARANDRPTVPPVPAALEAPADVAPFFIGHAEGTQNYVCLPTATGVAWRFVGPQATVFGMDESTTKRQVTTHYLSANPAESGTPRPTWQHSFDSSRAWGRAIASSTDPAYVAAGAIPWLLVEVVGVEEGPRGNSVLAATRYIHRVNTSGGVAPTSGCSGTANIGALALVPYTTDYVFYELHGEP